MRSTRTYFTQKKWSLKLAKLVFRELLSKEKRRRPRDEMEEEPATAEQKEANMSSS